MKRLRLLLLLAALGAPAQDYLGQLPTGEDWVAHLTRDLLPFWAVPAALGDPAGSFPSTRCDNGAALDFAKPCPPIAGNTYLMAHSQYLVPLSRQMFGYGVAYHLTGDPKYLDWMRAGVAYIRKNTLDPAGGMFTEKNLDTGVWGPAREVRDPQQLGYGLLGLAFYYYLTHDAEVLPEIDAVKKYIERNYANAALGTNQWLLRSNGSTRFDQKNLVADLDQVNTYLALLAPILPEPYGSEWRATLARLSRSMIATFYVPHDNLFFLSANTAADRNLASSGPDFGHTSKALWMLRRGALVNGDRGLEMWATAAARRHLERAYVAEDGSWATGVQPGGAVDKNKNWWIFAELDQLAGTLATVDPALGRPLPQTNRYWFQYFVDHEYGDVWNGVNYGTNSPQKDFPKAWQWKSAYHDFEHALVGHITAQQLLGRPFTLYYAFAGAAEQSTIQPYYFAAAVDSVTTTGSGRQAVTFRATASRPASADAVVVSAASGLGGFVAADSIAMAYSARPLKAGTTVTVNAREAQVLFADAGQVNFVVPASSAEGAATIAMTAADGTVVTGAVTVVRAQPGVFQMTPLGLCAANVIRVKGGSQTVEAVYESSKGTVGPRPIAIGSDDVYFAIYGTGLRNASSVAVRIASQELPVLWFGAQGEVEGLDQVNVGPAPKSLTERGTVTVVISADGHSANPVELVFQ